LNISFFSVGITSTFSCSWIPSNSFSSWPPLLRSYGISSCTFSSWAAPLLRSYDSLICISSFWTIPLGPTFVFSSWPDTFVIVGLPQMKSRIFFNKLPTCTLEFFHQLYVEPIFFPILL
jgi:hypothetical protein